MTAPSGNNEDNIDEEQSFESNADKERNCEDVDEGQEFKDFIKGKSISSRGHAIKLNEFSFIDATFLSHEDYPDNLDEVGRQLLDGCKVITVLPSMVPNILHQDPGLAKELGANVIIPIHLEPWNHFAEGSDELHKIVDQEEDIKSKIHCLKTGLSKIFRQFKCSY
ncbi:hypothetical protein BDC45DRAFT_601737 [Circinella umbellata]|nr:hypothetical protein BDC45DRAFT_601737 [Circinella umbellata]